jgi:hypothetical protein
MVTGHMKNGLESSQACWHFKQTVVDILDFLVARWP